MSVNQNIALKRKKEEFIIALRGDLDHHGTQQLRADLEDALLACREMRVVFELSEVSFMDSSGIGLLLGRYKAIKNRGCWVELRGAQPAVDKLLAMSGLYQIMKKSA